MSHTKKWGVGHVTVVQHVIINDNNKRKRCCVQSSRDWGFYPYCWIYLHGQLFDLKRHIPKVCTYSSGLHDGLYCIGDLLYFCCVREEADYCKTEVGCWWVDVLVWMDFFLCVMALTLTLTFSFFLLLYLELLNNQQCKTSGLLCVFFLYYIYV